MAALSFTASPLADAHPYGLDLSESASAVFTVSKFVAFAEEHCGKARPVGVRGPVLVAEEAGSAARQWP